MNSIETIIKTAMESNISGYPVHLWLLSPSGHGKTTMLKRFSNNLGVYDFSGHITPNFIRTEVVPKLAAHRVHTFILDDIARIEPRYRAAVCEILQQIADGEVTIGQFENQSKTVLKCGLIISSTLDFWVGSQIRKILVELGLENRVLPIYFRNSEARMAEISAHALNGNEPLPEIPISVPSFFPLSEEDKTLIPRLTVHVRQQIMLARLRKIEPDLKIYEFLRGVIEI